MQSLPFDYLLSTHNCALCCRKTKLKSKAQTLSSRNQASTLGWKIIHIFFKEAPYVYEQFHAKDLWLGIQESWVLLYLHCEHALILPFCISDSSTVNCRGYCSFLQSTNLNWAHSRRLSVCQASKVVKEIVANSSNMEEMGTPLAILRWWLVMDGAQQAAWASRREASPV